MDRKWLVITLFAIASYTPLIAPPRVYNVVASSGQELSSNRPTEAGIADLRTYLVAQSKLYGVNPTRTLWIVSHESQFDPTRIGDDTLTCPVGPNKGKAQHSRGLWQISDCFHPEVTDQCALDYQCSTQFSLRLILAGKINEWSTWRFRFAWYPNENPPL